MAGVPLQRCLRHDTQQTTEIYGGRLEIGTKKQTDYLNDFWKDKLKQTKGVASIRDVKTKGSDSCDHH